MSLVNGSPCTTGLTCVALDRAMRLLDWADAAAAFTYGVLGRQQNTFADEPMRLRKSPGLWETARHLREGLTGTVRNGADVRTQDPMSIRAVPQIHGAIRDSLATIAETAERELASVTDNPLVKGSPEEPVVYSQAHALSTTLAFAMDQLAIVTTQLGIISGVERTGWSTLSSAASRFPFRRKWRWLRVHDCSIYGSLALRREPQTFCARKH